MCVCVPGLVLRCGLWCVVCVCGCVYKMEVGSSYKDKYDDDGCAVDLALKNVMQGTKGEEERGGHHKEGERERAATHVSWEIGARQWHHCPLYVPVFLRGIAAFSRLYAELAKGGVFVSYDHLNYKHGKDKQEKQVKAHEMREGVSCLLE